MLIELQAISGNGSEIGYLRDGDVIPPLVMAARPNTLSLSKKIVFNPSTAEGRGSPFRERTYCSLPEKKHAPRILSPALQAPAQETFSTNAKPPPACYSWVSWKWHKFLRKSSRTDVKATSNVVRRNRKTSFSYRKRAATVSQIPTSSEKENKLDWGEEAHNDVVYKVVLERIVRSPDSTTQNDESADGLQYVTQKVRYIKGAILSHLVGRLCRFYVPSDERQEDNLVNIFLSTYRSFASPVEVLDLIAKEMETLNNENVENKKAILRSITQVLRVWLERFFEEDFYNPPNHSLLKRLRDLAEKYQNGSLEDSSSPESDCDFLTFTKSRLQSAEVKGLQEEACEKIGSPSFSDILNETEDVCVEEESLNMEASRTFLNHFSPHQLAEQLTVKDSYLFLRVVPHHCLDAVRSSKDKPATVKATISQFNRVAQCVQGTCLCPRLKTSLRAKVISKWIDVANVCRELRNFSSLHAIVSGLKTHAIHRLKRTWHQVSPAHVNLLEELSKISMKDSLIKASGNKSCSEKGMTMRGRKDMTLRRHQTLQSCLIHGTVPYLGSVLTDLTYLHTAKPDYIKKNLINYNKMKKEYEVLAQIQLWQASCRSYQQYESDQTFSDWFDAVTLPTDEQTLQLSHKIESLNSIPLSPGTPLKRAFSEILATQIMDVSGIDPKSFQAEHKTSPSKEQEQSPTDSDQTSTKANGNAVVETPSDKELRTVNVQIIMKNWKEENSENQPVTKQIELCSNDRSPAFMKKVFSRFEMEVADLKSYSLVQIISEDKELTIPDTGNVFYAMNSSTSEYNFALIEDGAELPREKRDHRSRNLPVSGKPKRHSKKSTNASSASSAVSPMKSIYRHIGMSLVSGFYSPVKETQRQESLQEKRESLTTVDASARKKSEDDSVISSISNSFSDDSEAESDSFGFKKKIEKFLGKNKGHRRNFSDSGYRMADALISPARYFQYIGGMSDNASISGFRVFDSDAEESGEKRSWSQKQARSEQSVRKAHSLPREAHLRTDKQSSSRFMPTVSSNSSKLLRKRESRSRFYVIIDDARTHSRSSASFDSAESSPADVRTPTDCKQSPLRSVSESYLLELTEGENDVFGADVAHPAITVQQPSPEKKQDVPSPNDITTSDMNDVSTQQSPRRRCASETRTTAL